jgi:pimeloyl-ACP methyl ester carboxylesterase
MPHFAHSLAAAIPGAMTYRIEGAGHAAPFDATTKFVELIADSITSLRTTRRPSDGVPSGP